MPRNSSFNFQVHNGNPCRDCGERRCGCHDDCERYITRSEFMRTKTSEEKRKIYYDNMTNKITGRSGKVKKR